MRLARLGGLLCLVVSLGLFARVLVIGRLNAVVVGVLLGAALAGLLTLRRPGTVGTLMAAQLILIVALVPAAFGWVPLLFLPSLALLLAGTLQAVREQDQEEGGASRQA
jgi:hypothetical protein